MIDVLAKMKEICPKDDNGNPTYGASLFNDWDGNMVMFVKALATAYFGYDEFDFGLYDPETGKFYGSLEADGPYMYTLKFFNKLMQAGLVDPDSMTQKWERFIEANDLPKIRLHALRHSNATALIEAGVNAKVVQQRLGHADVSITLNTYTHVLPEMDKKAADTLDELLIKGA